MAEAGLAVDAAPPELQRWWSDPSPQLTDILYRPDVGDGQSLSLAAALDELASSAIPAPTGLLPVTFVDDRSFACLTVENNREYGWRAGQIIRWHLDLIEAKYQGALLDTDIDTYIESLVEEVGSAWSDGYDGMMELSRAYHVRFVEPQRVPKPYDLRPFQLACQNVVIGLAAFQRDLRIDGLAVPFWLTCDVPHVATYESSRALSALMLCDAFQSGGTMEVSFARHPEHRVPASLRRYARTLGVELGREVPGGSSISPSEARKLFWAVTPMPDELRQRCERLVDTGVCSVERLCYSLLSPVWGAPALDFLLACGDGRRIMSILEGGADVLDRSNRSAEMELARAAVMVEMFVKRADAKDVVADIDAANEVRLFEDTSNGVEWRVLGEFGVVEISGLPPGPVPWHQSVQSDGRVIVMPRPHPVRADFQLAERLSRQDGLEGGPILILTSIGSVLPSGAQVSVLRCPMRLSEIDLHIERTFVSSSLGRA